jgi:hypothetical protein
VEYRVVLLLVEMVVLVAGVDLVVQLLGAQAHLVRAITVVMDGLLHHMRRLAVVAQGL